MSNKITIAILSLLVIFFLTAQTCSMPSMSTGIAADCVGEGDILCDDTEAYECLMSAYGTGYYVSRASEYDVSECGAEEEEQDLTAYETIIETIEKKYDIVNQDLTDAVVAYEVSTDEEAYFAVKTTLDELQGVIDAQQTKLEDLATDLSAEEQTTDVTDVESTVASLQDAFTLLEIKVADVMADVESALSGTETTCSTDTDCSGYLCESGYCEYSCEEDYDCTTGYVCDRSTSATGLCELEAESATTSATGYTASAIYDVEITEGTLYEDLYFYYYDEGAFSYWGYLDSSSNLFSGNTGPEDADILLVGTHNLVWLGFDGLTLTLTTDNSDAETVNVYLPEIDKTDLDTTAGDFFYLYIAEDGSTYYASENHGFSNDYMSPEEALIEEHLARQNPW